ncbi:MAG TPA: sulfotransferase [Verrucomicrobiae bacterium]|nr:sulfotransferase [Verrucomicrobiae bacterium]
MSVAGRLPFERIALLMGMPRSGTSWLSQIVDSSPDVRFRLSPLFSWAFKNAASERSSRAEWEEVLRGAWEREDRFMSQTYQREAGRYPVFAVKQEAPRVLAIKDTRYHQILERLLELFECARLVAIVRHPCGAVHSWLTTPKEFPDGADKSAEWRTGACRKTAPEEFWGFDDWKAVTRLHLDLARRHPRRVLVVRYEDLVGNAAMVGRRVLRFLDLAWTAQTGAFVAESQSRHIEDTHAVFKDPSVMDRWRRELSPDIQEAIRGELEGSDLAEFLS